MSQMSAFSITVFLTIKSIVDSSLRYKKVGVTVDDLESGHARRLRES